MTHFFTHRLPLLSGSLTNLIIMFYTQMIDWLIIISFSNNKSEIEVLTAATDLLLGFASLNSRRKSSLWHRTLRNQLKTVKKRKKQWGKWEVLQEDEESAWRSLRFVWVLRRRLLLPSSCFQSEIKKKNRGEWSSADLGFLRKMESGTSGRCSSLQLSIGRLSSRVLWTRVKNR